MPRRSSKSRSTKVQQSTADTSSTIQTGQQPSSSSSSSVAGSTSRRGKTSSSRRRYVETESWVRTRLDELVDAFGLRDLNLSEDEYEVVLEKVIDVLRGESATLDFDSIVKRFRRYRDNISNLIAITILELREELSPEQLEYIANYIGDAVLSYAPRLYAEALKLGRTDIIDRLRALWSSAWLNKRGAPLPLKCPHCGFDALMPDLACLVCGRNVSERELKDFVGFKKLLLDFASTLSREEIAKLISSGFIYLSSIGLKIPGSEDRHPLDVEIALNREEKELLHKVLVQKGGENEGGEYRRT